MTGEEGDLICVSEKIGDHPPEQQAIVAIALTGVLRPLSQEREKLKWRNVSGESHNSSWFGD